MITERTIERATELGRMIGQTDEYGALSRARKRVEEDTELLELLRDVETVEREVAALLQQGEEPGEEMREKYESAMSRLQTSSGYQSLVAAQSNFEKVLARVNQAIAAGMEEGGTSRIIMPK